MISPGGIAAGFSHSLFWTIVFILNFLLLPTP
jgi:hypothetical protein